MVLFRPLAVSRDLDKTSSDYGFCLVHLEFLWIGMEFLSYPHPG